MVKKNGKAELKWIKYTQKVYRFHLLIIKENGFNRIVKNAKRDRKTRKTTMAIE